VDDCFFEREKQLHGIWAKIALICSNMIDVILSSILGGSSICRMHRHKYYSSKTVF